MCELHTLVSLLLFFFFNDTATTEIYTLSLHDALPISYWPRPVMKRGSSRRLIDFPNSRSSATVAMSSPHFFPAMCSARSEEHTSELQSPCISYAVFCLKKKKKKIQ